jgi:hypothetical protein
MTCHRLPERGGNFGVHSFRIHAPKLLLYLKLPCKRILLRVVLRCCAAGFVGGSFIHSLAAAQLLLGIYIQERTT